MIIVTPGINLNGTCAEAIALYEKAFGAKTKLMMRYADADPRDWDTPLTDEQRTLIYHAEVFIGSQRIMFSDVLDDGLVQGTALFLVLTFDDADSVKKAYAVLEEGSTIIHPMVSTTYSSCFVSLVDKFGIRWGLMTEQAER